MISLDEIPTNEFGHFLHALRTRRLSTMPGDARVALSGGAAGAVYFQWFGDHYPGHIERHIGVEYFAPPPDPLPQGVEWLPRTLGDLSPVPDGEIDLVFAGQVIEHLWPDDVAGFLCEANRVLRPRGALVIDSPTRFVANGLGWTHPEHTIELEVDEIVELLELAGFVDIDVKGVWLCYDRERSQMMRLDLLGGGPDWPWQRRVIEAEGRPHDSFIWWAEARNGGNRGDAAAVRRRIGEIYDMARPLYFDRPRTEIGEAADDSLGRRFRATRGNRGFLLRGPSIALPPGRHEAVFRLTAAPTEGWLSPSRKLADVEITRDGGRVIADWSLTARDLPPGGAERELVLPFELRDTAFDCEFRVRSLGTATLIVNAPVELHEGVADGRRPDARALGDDPARVRIDAALRTAQRVVGWPARRILDPRLEGLRNHGQMLAASIGERIDARALELAARVDGLGNHAGPPVVASTERDRSAVLPYVLRGLATLTPPSTILTTDSPEGVVSVVLATLGYDIVTAPPPEAARWVAGAFVRGTSVEDEGVEDAIRAVQPGGVLVLITEEPDRSKIERLLDGWRIDDESVTESRVDGGPTVTFMRASSPHTERA